MSAEIGYQTNPDGPAEQPDVPDALFDAAHRDMAEDATALRILDMIETLADLSACGFVHRIAQEGVHPHEADAVARFARLADALAREREKRIEREIQGLAA